MATPTDLLNRQLALDGTRPLFTFYDGASGERVELSVATTANWVAKTAGYLADEHGVDVGDLVVLRLPVHWQTAVVLLAAWAAGAQVSFEPDPASVVTVTTRDGDAGNGETVRLSLDPMGADFSRLVAAQPDAFIPTAATGEDLVAAAATDLPHGARVLSVLPYDEAAAISYGLVAPLAVDGSVVLVRNAAQAELGALVATERVTHSLGVAIDGVPRLD
jgi:uncharacterized protein (TIGR03089 family)